MSLLLLQASLSPVLVAAKGGHAKCVIHLIDKGANLRVKSASDLNYLMEAIRAGHELVGNKIVIHATLDTK